MYGYVLHYDEKQFINFNKQKLRFVIATTLNTT